MTADDRGPARLVEDSEAQGGDGDGDGAWAVDLLRSAAPYRAPAGRKQRVKLSLGHSAPHRAPRLLRPVIVAGMLIGCGAFASAALGHWPGWIARAYDRWVAPAASVAMAPAAEARRHAHAQRIAEAPAPSVPAVELAAAEPPALAPVAAPAPAREPSAPRAHRAPTPAAAGEDPSAVLEAMRALRLDHDPVRARVLLGRYLERHPGGALAEEALAMSIEAAVAHHDPDAAALGARYLRLYPNGPFHTLAGQTKR